MIIKGEKMEKNQKIIIGALVVIIAVIAIVGTVMFIDDRDRKSVV